MGFSFCRICFIMITVKFIKQMKNCFYENQDRDGEFYEAGQ